MKEFFDSFSNRDIAFIIWTLLPISALFLSKGIRESLGDVLKHLFVKNIMTVLLLTFCYIGLEAWALYQLDMLGPGQIKDAVYWTFGVALISLFRITKIRNTAHFKDILIQTFKLTVVVEFLVNLYVFSLPVELGAVFVATTLSLLKVVADQKEDTKQVSKVIEHVLAVFGYGVLIFVVYNIVQHYREIPTFENLKTLMIVPILTVLFIPLLYAICLYSNYETLFIRINFLARKPEQNKDIKRFTLRFANLDLNKLEQVAQNLHKHDFYYEENIKQYVKSLTAGKLHPMSTSDLIDGRNKELWDALRQTQEIEIRREDRGDYLTYSQGKKSIIHVPNNDVNSDSFTHELLHIELRDKEVFVGGAIKRSVAGKPILVKLLSQDLLDHIGNCLDHMKMLPRYISLGYNEDFFIQDYKVNKLPVEEAELFKLFFDKTGNSYNRYFTDQYIGKFFAVKSCPNSEIDYTQSLSLMKEADGELYAILDEFVEAWKEYDPDSTNPIVSSYHMPVFDFVDRLEAWTRGKNIT